VSSSSFPLRLKPEGSVPPPAGARKRPERGMDLSQIRFCGCAALPRLIFNFLARDVIADIVRPSWRAIALVLAPASASFRNFRSSTCVHG
jgi:hypothetical protein